MDDITDPPLIRSWITDALQQFDEELKELHALQEASEQSDQQALDLIRQDGAPETGGLLGTTRSGTGAGGMHRMASSRSLGSHHGTHFSTNSTLSGSVGGHGLSTTTPGASVGGALGGGGGTRRGKGVVPPEEVLLAAAEQERLLQARLESVRQQQAQRPQSQIRRHYEQVRQTVESVVEPVRQRERKELEFFRSRHSERFDMDDILNHSRFSSSNLPSNTGTPTTTTGGKNRSTKSYFPNEEDGSGGGEGSTGAPLSVASVPLLPDGEERGGGAPPPHSFTVSGTGGKSGGKTGLALQGSFHGWKPSGGAGEASPPPGGTFRGIPGYRAVNPASSVTSFSAPPSRAETVSGGAMEGRVGGGGLLTRVPGTMITTTNLPTGQPGSALSSHVGSPLQPGGVGSAPELHFFRAFPEAAIDLTSLDWPSAPGAGGAGVGVGGGGKPQKGKGLITTSPSAPGGGVKGVGVGGPTASTSSSSSDRRTGVRREPPFIIDARQFAMDHNESLRQQYGFKPILHGPGAGSESELEGSEGVGSGERGEGPTTSFPAGSGTGGSGVRRHRSTTAGGGENQRGRSSGSHTSTTQAAGTTAAAAGSGGRGGSSSSTAAVGSDGGSGMGEGRRTMSTRAGFLPGNPVPAPPPPSTTTTTTTTGQGILHHPSTPSSSPLFGGALAKDLPGAPRISGGSPPSMGTFSGTPPGSAAGGGPPPGGSQREVLQQRLATHRPGGDTELPPFILPAYASATAARTGAGGEGGRRRRKRIPREDSNEDKDEEEKEDGGGKGNVCSNLPLTVKEYRQGQRYHSGRGDGRGGGGKQSPVTTSTTGGHDSEEGGRRRGGRREGHGKHSQDSSHRRRHHRSSSSGSSTTTNTSSSACTSSGSSTSSENMDHHHAQRGGQRRKKQKGETETEVELGGSHVQNGKRGPHTTEELHDGAAGTLRGGRNGIPSPLLSSSSSSPKEVSLMENARRYAGLPLGMECTAKDQTIHLQAALFERVTTVVRFTNRNPDRQRLRVHPSSEPWLTYTCTQISPVAGLTGKKSAGLEVPVSCGGYVEVEVAFLPTHLRCPVMESVLEMGLCRYRHVQSGSSAAGSGNSGGSGSNGNTEHKNGPPSFSTSSPFTTSTNTTTTTTTNQGVGNGGGWEFYRIRVYAKTILPKPAVFRIHLTPPSTSAVSLSAGGPPGTGTSFLPTRPTEATKETRLEGKEEHKEATGTKATGTRMGLGPLSKARASRVAARSPSPGPAAGGPPGAAAAAAAVGVLRSPSNVAAAALTTSTPTTMEKERQESGGVLPFSGKRSGKEEEGGMDPRRAVVPVPFPRCTPLVQRDTIRFGPALVMSIRTSHFYVKNIGSRARWILYCTSSSFRVHAPSYYRRPLSPSHPQFQEQATIFASLQPFLFSLPPSASSSSAVAMPTSGGKKATTQASGSVGGVGREVPSDRGIWSEATTRESRWMALTPPPSLSPLLPSSIRSSLLSANPTLPPALPGIRTERDTMGIAGEEMGRLPLVPPAGGGAGPRRESAPSTSFSPSLKFPLMPNESGIEREGRGKRPVGEDREEEEEAGRFPEARGMEVVDGEEEEQEEGMLISFFLDRDQGTAFSVEFQPREEGEVRGELICLAVEERNSMGTLVPLRPLVGGGEQGGVGGTITGAGGMRKSILLGTMNQRAHFFSSPVRDDALAGGGEEKDADVAAEESAKLHGGSRNQKKGNPRGNGREGAERRGREMLAAVEQQEAVVARHVLQLCGAGVLPHLTITRIGDVAVESYQRETPETTKKMKNKKKQKSHNTDPMDDTLTGGPEGNGGEVSVARVRHPQWDMGNREEVIPHYFVPQTTPHLTSNVVVEVKNESVFALPFHWRVETNPSTRTSASRALPGGCSVSSGRSHRLPGGGAGGEDGLGKKKPSSPHRTREVKKGAGAEVWKPRFPSAAAYPGEDMEENDDDEDEESAMVAIEPCTGFLAPETTSSFVVSLEPHGLAPVVVSLALFIEGLPNPYPLIPLLPSSSERVGREGRPLSPPTLLASAGHPPPRERGPGEEVEVEEEGLGRRDGLAEEDPSRGVASSSFVMEVPCTPHAPSGVSRPWSSEYPCCTPLPPFSASLTKPPPPPSSSSLPRRRVGKEGVEEGQARGGTATSLFPLPPPPGRSLMSPPLTGGEAGIPWSLPLPLPPLPEEWQDVPPWIIGLLQRPKWIPSARLATVVFPSDAVLPSTTTTTTAAGMGAAASRVVRPPPPAPWSSSTFLPSLLGTTWLKTTTTSSSPYSKGKSKKGSRLRGAPPPTTTTTMAMVKRATTFSTSTTPDLYADPFSQASPLLALQNTTIEPDAFVTGCFLHLQPSVPELVMIPCVFIETVECLIGHENARPAMLHNHSPREIHFYFDPTPEEKEAWNREEAEEGRRRRRRQRKMRSQQQRRSHSGGVRRSPPPCRTQSRGSSRTSSACTSNSESSSSSSSSRSSNTSGERTRRHTSHESQITWSRERQGTSPLVGCGRSRSPIRETPPLPRSHGSNSSPTHSKKTTGGGVGGGSSFESPSSSFASSSFSMHAVPRSGVLAPFSSVHVSVRFTIKRAGVYREKIPLWIPEVSALYPAGTPPFHAVEVEAIGRGPAVHTSTNTLEFGLLELGKETHTSFTVTNDNPIPVVVQLLDPSPPSYPPSDTTEAGAPLPAPLPPRYVFLPPTFSLFPGDAMEVTVYRRAVVLEDGRGFFEIHTPHGGVMVMETRATIQEPTLMVEEAVLNFGVVPEGVWQDGAFYVSNPTALENPVQVRVASPYSNYLELEVQEPHLLIRAGEPHAAVKVRARFQYHPREEAKRRRKQQKDEEARRKRRRQEEALEKARQKRAAAAAAAEEEEEDEEEGVNSAVNGTTGGSTEGEGSGVEAGGTGGGAHTTNSNTSILEKGDEKKAGRSDGTRRSFTPSFHAVTEAANWEDVFSSPDAVGKGSEEKEPRRRQKKENTFSPATSTTIVATNTTEQEEEEDNEDTVIPHYYQGLIAVESMKNHQVLLVEVCCDRVERLTVSVDMAEIKPHAHPTMQASTTLLKYFLPLVPPARNTALTAAAAAATATFPPSPSPYRSIEKSTGSLGKSHLGRSSIKGEFLLATSPGAAAAAAVAAKRPPFLSSALSPAAANDPGRPLLSTHRTRHGKRDGQRPCSSGRAVSLHSPRSPLEALPPFSPPLKKGLPGIKDPAAWRMTLAYAADWGEAPLEFFFHSFLWNLIDHRVLPIADARAARRLARRRHRRRRRRRRLCRRRHSSHGHSVDQEEEERNGEEEEEGQGVKWSAQQKRERRERRRRKPHPVRHPSEEGVNRTYSEEQRAKQDTRWGRHRSVEVEEGSILLSPISGTSKMSWMGSRSSSWLESSSSLVASRGVSSPAGSIQQQQQQEEVVVDDDDEIPFTSPLFPPGPVAATADGGEDQAGRATRRSRLPREKGGAVPTDRDTKEDEEEEDDSEAKKRASRKKTRRSVGLSDSRVVTFSSPTAAETSPGYEKSTTTTHPPTPFLPPSRETGTEDGEEGGGEHRLLGLPSSEGCRPPRFASLLPLSSPLKSGMTEPFSQHGDRDNDIKEPTTRQTRASLLLSEEEDDDDEEEYDEDSDEEDEEEDAYGTEDDEDEDERRRGGSLSQEGSSDAACTALRTPHGGTEKGGPQRGDRSQQRRRRPPHARRRRRRSSEALVLSPHREDMERNEERSVRPYHPYCAPLSLRSTLTHDWPLASTTFLVLLKNYTGCVSDFEVQVQQYRPWAYVFDSFLAPDGSVMEPPAKKLHASQGHRLLHWNRHDGRPGSRGECEDSTIPTPAFVSRRGSSESISSSGGSSMADARLPPSSSLLPSEAWSPASSRSARKGRRGTRNGLSHRRDSSSDGRRGKGSGRRSPPTRMISSFGREGEGKEMGSRSRSRSISSETTRGSFSHPSSRDGQPTNVRLNGERRGVEGAGPSLRKRTQLLSLHPAALKEGMEAAALVPAASPLHHQGSSTQLVRAGAGAGTMLPSSSMKTLAFSTMDGRAEKEPQTTQAFLLSSFPTPSFWTTMMNGVEAKQQDDREALSGAQHRLMDGRGGATVLDIARGGIFPYDVIPLPVMMMSNLPGRYEETLDIHTYPERLTPVEVSITWEVDGNPILLDPTTSGLTTSGRQPVLLMTSTIASVGRSRRHLRLINRVPRDVEVSVAIFLCAGSFVVSAVEDPMSFTNDTGAGLENDAEQEQREREEGATGGEDNAEETLEPIHDNDGAAIAGRPPLSSDPSAARPPSPRGTRKLVLPDGRERSGTTVGRFTGVLHPSTGTVRSSAELLGCTTGRATSGSSFSRPPSHADTAMGYLTASTREAFPDGGGGGDGMGETWRRTRGVEEEGDEENDEEEGSFEDTTVRLKLVPLSGEAKKKESVGKGKARVNPTSFFMRANSSKEIYIEYEPDLNIVRTVLDRLLGENGRGCSSASVGQPLSKREAGSSYGSLHTLRTTTSPAAAVVGTTTTTAGGTMADGPASRTGKLEGPPFMVGGRGGSERTSARRFPSSPAPRASTPPPASPTLVPFSFSSATPGNVWEAPPPAVAGMNIGDEPRHAPRSMFQRWLDWWENDAASSEAGGAVSSVGEGGGVGSGLEGSGGHASWTDRPGNTTGEPTTAAQEVTWNGSIIIRAEIASSVFNDSFLIDEFYERYQSEYPSIRSLEGLREGRMGSGGREGSAESRSGGGDGGGGFSKRPGTSTITVAAPPFTSSTAVATRALKSTNDKRGLLRGNTGVGARAHPPRCGTLSTGGPSWGLASGAVRNEKPSTTLRNGREESEGGRSAQEGHDLYEKGDGREEENMEDEEEEEKEVEEGEGPRVHVYHSDLCHSPEEFRLLQRRVPLLEIRRPLRSRQHVLRKNKILFPSMAESVALECALRQQGIRQVTPQIFMFSGVFPSPKSPLLRSSVSLLALPTASLYPSRRSSTRGGGGGKKESVAFSSSLYTALLRAASLWMPGRGGAEGGVSGRAGSVLRTPRGRGGDGMTSAGGSLAGNLAGRLVAALSTLNATQPSLPESPLFHTATGYPSLNDVSSHRLSRSRLEESHRTSLSPSLATSSRGGGGGNKRELASTAEGEDFTRRRPSSSNDGIGITTRRRVGGGDRHRRRSSTVHGGASYRPRLGVGELLRQAILSGAIRDWITSGDLPPWMQVALVEDWLYPAPPPSFSTTTPTGAGFSMSAANSFPTSPVAAGPPPLGECSALPPTKFKRTTTTTTSAATTTSHEKRGTRTKKRALQTKKGEHGAAVSSETDEEVEWKDALHPSGMGEPDMSKRPAKRVTLKLQRNEQHPLTTTTTTTLAEGGAKGGGISKDGCRAQEEGRVLHRSSFSLQSISSEEVEPTSLAAPLSSAALRRETQEGARQRWKGSRWAILPGGAALENIEDGHSQSSMSSCTGAAPSTAAPSTRAPEDAAPPSSAGPLFGGVPFLSAATREAVEMEKGREDPHMVGYVDTSVRSPGVEEEEEESPEEGEEAEGEEENAKPHEEEDEDEEDDSSQAMMQSIRDAEEISQAAAGAHRPSQITGEATTTGLVRRPLEHLLREEEERRRLLLYLVRRRAEVREESRQYFTPIELLLRARCGVPFLDVQPSVGGVYFPPYHASLPIPVQDDNEGENDENDEIRKDREARASRRSSKGAAHNSLLLHGAGPPFFPTTPSRKTATTDRDGKERGERRGPEQGGQAGGSETCSFSQRGPSSYSQGTASTTTTAVVVERGGGKRENQKKRKPQKGRCMRTVRLTNYNSAAVHVAMEVDPQFEIIALQYIASQVEHEPLQEEGGGSGGGATAAGGGQKGKPQKTKRKGVLQQYYSPYDGDETENDNDDNAASHGGSPRRHQREDTSYRSSSSSPTGGGMAASGISGDGAVTGVTMEMDKRLVYTLRCLDVLHVTIAVRDPEKEARTVDPLYQPRVTLEGQLYLYYYDGTTGRTKVEAPNRDGGGGAWHEGGLERTQGRRTPSRGRSTSSSSGGEVERERGMDPSMLLSVSGPQDGRGKGKPYGERSSSSSSSTHRQDSHGRGRRGTDVALLGRRHAAAEQTVQLYASFNAPNVKVSPLLTWFQPGETLHDGRPQPRGTLHVQLENLSQEKVWFRLVHVPRAQAIQDGFAAPLLPFISRRGLLGTPAHLTMERKIREVMSFTAAASLGDGSGGGKGTPIERWPSAAVGNGAGGVMVEGRGRNDSISMTGYGPGWNASTMMSMGGGGMDLAEAHPSSLLPSSGGNMGGMISFTSSALRRLSMTGNGGGGAKPSRVMGGGAGWDAVVSPEPEDLDGHRDRMTSPGRGGPALFSGSSPPPGQNYTTPPSRQGAGSPTPMMFPYSNTAKTGLPAGRGFPGTTTTIALDGNEGSGGGEEKEVWDDGGSYFVVDDPSMFSFEEHQGTLPPATRGGMPGMKDIRIQFQEHSNVRYECFFRVWINEKPSKLFFLVRGDSRETEI